MTRLPLLLATAALAGLSLAACSKPAGETATSAEATTAAPAAATPVVGSTIQPGYWESAVLATGEEPRVDHDCVTAEDSDLKGQLNKSLKTSNCTYARQQVGGGRIDIEGTCAGQEGVVGTSTIKLSGNYTPTTYNAEMSISMTVQGKPMNMNWKVTGKRVGDTCPAEDKE